MLYVAPAEMAGSVSVPDGPFEPDQSPDAIQSSASGVVSHVRTGTTVSTPDVTSAVKVMVFCAETGSANINKNNVSNRFMVLSAIGFGTGKDIRAPWS